MTNKSANLNQECYCIGGNGKNYNSFDIDSIDSIDPIANAYQNY